MDNSEKCETDLSTRNENYVSCIKIYGLEILPPILTDEKRKCMQYFRDLAIQVEEKIRKRNLNDTTESENSVTYNDSEASSICESVLYSSDKSSNDEPTYKSQIFTDSCRSDVLLMLNDCKNKNSDSLVNNMQVAAVELPLLDKSEIKNVPLNSSNVVESDMKKCFEESDITVKSIAAAVTQESSASTDAENSFDVMKHEQLTNSKTCISLQNMESDSNVNSNEIDSSNQNAINNNNNNNNNSIEDTVNTDSESLEEKSPLIRRNSYILENPSPYLLALINQSNTDTAPEKPSLNTSGHKRRRWNLEQAREKWSSIEQDLNNVMRTSTVKRSVMNFNSLPTSTVTSPETKMFNSSLVSLPNKAIVKAVSKSQLPEKESEIPTNDKPKNSPKNRGTSAQHARDNCINGISETSNRFIKSYATPLKKPSLQKKNDNKMYISPNKMQLEQQKTKTSTLIKKTDILKNSINSTMKQRKLSLDETKRNSPTIKSHYQSSSDRTSIVLKSPGTSPKSQKISKNYSLKSVTSDCIIPKKQNIVASTISEQQLKEIINKVNLEQSNQMAMLLAKQRAEQEELMKLFAEQQATLFSKLKSTYQTLIKENNQTEPVIQTTNKFSTALVLDLNHSENLLMECRKLLDFETSYAETSESPYSPDDSLMNITPRSNQIESSSIIASQQYSFHIDFNRNSKQSDLQIYDLEPFCPASTSSNYKTFSTDSLEATVVDTSVNSTTVKPRNVSSCSRQLFPTEKQIWAATILCAATRGFLVRRLIKTERVQNLVKTIRDSLLCAMELHHEKADNIQPADVELHRRLIQQVTATCHSFHDTFFDLSTPEQMCIIALDRERQKEKLLRPVSAKSNTSLTSTTQKVIERKLNRISSDSMSGNPSRCSSSRSSYNMGDFRPRTKSLGMQEAMEQNSTKKTSPSNDVIMHRAMNYSANKKPWR